MDGAMAHKASKYGVPKRIDGRNNPEYQKRYFKDYQEANKGKLKEYLRNYYIVHKGELIQKAISWNRSNIEQRKIITRKDKYLRKYGFSIADYDAMSHCQNGVCAICGQPNNNGKRLDVDHNHDSGKVRGLLCNSCNRGIGYLKDDAEVLLKAAEYLNKNH